MRNGKSLKIALAVMTIVAIPVVAGAAAQAIRVQVNGRAVAEALGAEVGWNQSTQTVEIRSDSASQLELLQFALVSQTPDAVANTWAKGVMTRNGALQYRIQPAPPGRPEGT